MTTKESDAKYALQIAKRAAKDAVDSLTCGSPDASAMAALAVVDAVDAALKELNLRIAAGEREWNR